MRVAVAGKGGAGKTTITATVARTIAAGGRPVVAVDADSNPNLGMALGAPHDDQPMDLPPTLVSRRFDGPHLTEPVDDVLARCSAIAPDGVRLLRMGMPAHAEQGCLCGAHATVSALLGELGERPDIVTLVDLEASPEHLSRGTARHADVLALVAEPYYRSLETVRRLASLAAELPIPHVVVVVNKVRTEDDHDVVVEFCDRHDLHWLGDVPWSDDVTAADRNRVPLIDRAPGAPVLAALSRLADELVTLGPARPEVGA